MTNPSSKKNPRGFKGDVPCSCSLTAAGWMRLGRKKGQHVKLIIFENNILLIRDKQKKMSRET